MPILASARHEAFCLALAKGMSASTAYVAAGYRLNRGNASRLKANEIIQARVDELLEEKFRQIVDDTVYGARTLFTRMWVLSEEAAAAGDYRVSMRCLMAIIDYLGYGNNPAHLRELLQSTPSQPRVREQRSEESRAKVAEIIQKFQIGRAGICANVDETTNRQAH